MALAVRTVDRDIKQVWLTFDDFIELKEAGRFGDPDWPMELVDGRVYRLDPVSMAHFTGSSNLVESLRSLVRRIGKWDEWVAGSNGILQLSRTRGVQPDGMVVRRTSNEFAQARDCFLAAEYAVSSRRRDLVIKPRLYAQAGVPEYWAVDQRNGTLHVFRDPVDGLYVERLPPLSAEKTISALFAPDVAIPVADLL